MASSSANGTSPLVMKGVDLRSVVSAAGEGAGRRSERIRKVSDKMAVVDDEFQHQAILAHLDELEMDHVDPGGEASEEEFEIAEEEEEANVSRPKKRRAEAGVARKRTTRSMLEQKHGTKTFTTLLQEAQLDQLPSHVPTYLTAAAQPPRHSTARKLCSVCGTISRYQCTRCGARFCCQKCYAIHTDTRCLKFMA